MTAPRTTSAAADYNFGLCAAVFLVSRAVYAVVALSAQYLYGKTPSIASLLMQGDAPWYFTIMSEGYYPLRDAESLCNSSPLFGQSPLGFFPLLPALAAPLANILPAQFALLTVSNAALFCSMLLLHRAAAARFGVRIARLTVIVCAVMPSSVVLSAGLSESTLLILSLLCTHLLWSGSRCWAAVIGAMVTIARPTGVLLPLALAIEWLVQAYVQRRERRADLRDLLAIAVMPSGALLLMTYNLAEFGDALAYLNTQRFWRLHLSYDIWRPLIFGYNLSLPPHLITLGITILILVVLIEGRRCLRLSELLFPLLVIMTAVTSATEPTSLPRYLIGCYPCYLAMAHRLDSASALKRDLFILFLVLLNIFCTVLWSVGLHVPL